MVAKSDKKPRVRKLPRHRTFRLTKKRLKQPRPLIGAPKLLRETSRIIFRNKRLFGGIALVNMLLSFVFVQGLGSSVNLNEFKDSFLDLWGEDAGRFTTSFALFGYMISAVGNGASEGAGAYQLFFALITSLAVIWAVRQIKAGEKPRLREAYYKGMYPLVPFVLVLVVVGLQLIPLLIGNLTYSVVTTNELATTVIEKVVWIVLFFVLALLSLYMIASSSIALYIATLPEMTPLKALRSARELVLHRRVALMLRVVALPLVLGLLSLLIFIPLLMVAIPVASILFMFISSFYLVIVHVYMYVLYRSLL